MSSSKDKETKKETDRESEKEKEKETEREAEKGKEKEKESELEKHNDPDSEKHRILVSSYNVHDLSYDDDKLTPLDEVDYGSTNEEQQNIFCYSGSTQQDQPLLVTTFDFPESSSDIDITSSWKSRSIFSTELSSDILDKWYICSQNN